MINTGQNTLRYLQAQSYPLTNKPAVVPEKTPQTEAKDGVQLSYSVSLPTQTAIPETSPQVEDNKPRLKEATGDMALMLESMERAEERSKQAGDDVLKGVQLDVLAQRSSGNSPIAVLDWGSAPTVEHSTSVDGFLATLVQIDLDKQAATEKQKAHPHPHPNPNHGLLGGHLGIEGGEHIAHEIVNAKAHGVSAVVDAKAHIAAQVASDASEAAVSHGSHVVKKAAAHHAETGEATGHAMSGFMTGLTGALAGASGILGVVMLAVGIADIKHGAKHGDKEHVVEGINHAVVGTRSLAAGTSMAGHIFHGSEILTSVAGIAKTALLPLGVAHGAIDAGLGAKQVYDGIKAKDAGKVTKGGLGVGLGVSLIAAAAGGGVPALVAAGVFLTGKIAHGIHQRRAAKAEVNAAGEHQ